MVSVLLVVFSALLVITLDGFIVTEVVVVDGVVVGVASLAVIGDAVVVAAVLILYASAVSTGVVAVA